MGRLKGVRVMGGVWREGLNIKMGKAIHEHYLKIRMLF
jgi:hypothetical protein